jgi:hypothetical protein
MWGSGLLRCVECDRPSNKTAEGWAAFLTQDPDGEGPTGVFCPKCAEAEFGWVSKRAWGAGRLDDPAGD